MAYVKKPKRKIKWKIAIPLICLILVVTYLVINVLFPHPIKTEGVTICDYDAAKTKKHLYQEQEATYEISDYFFYGENLSFLKEPYTLGEVDELYGKTIKLHNLCNDAEVLFQLSSSIDQQIDLGELENGFYEVFVVNNLQEYRLVSANEFSDEIHTVTRNEMTKKVEVISSSNYTKEETPLQKNYVYIHVASDLIQQESYDVLIDPFGGNNDNGTGVSYGFEANGLIENDEMYKAALVLKEKLEAYGLRVGITKQAIDQHLNTNGENGRAWIGYEHDAKLYLNLQFNKSEYSATNGIEITHSHYASSGLANQIIHDLEENVGLLGSLLYPGVIENGVAPSTMSKGDGSVAIYDFNSVIRETGGVATGAGSMSEAMRTQNVFANGNKKGMQALMMRLVYISNPIDYKLWTDSYEQIMGSIADSVATYYRIEAKDE